MIAARTDRPRPNHVQPRCFCCKPTRNTEIPTRKNNSINSEKLILITRSPNLIAMTVSEFSYWLRAVWQLCLNLNLQGELSTQRGTYSSSSSIQNLTFPQLKQFTRRSCPPDFKHISVINHFDRLEKENIFSRCFIIKMTNTQKRPTRRPHECATWTFFSISDMARFGQYPTVT